MSPPPFLGRARARGELSFDPALDDTALTTARDAFTRGRWTEARNLLAHTGDDWDRRGHRVVVLAETATGAARAREWQLAEPGSADAAALLACAGVFQAMRGRQPPQPARDACLAAARMAPADPTPWLGLLILACHTGSHDERLQAFEQVRARHREHHHAHHLMAACLAERHAGAADPLHEVYEFATWAAEEAPADSPLAVLPVVAHAERYRVLAGIGAEPPDPAGSPHWASSHARQAMKAAFDWWLEWDGEDHPRCKIDLNYLAHATFHEGRLPEAAALFARIGRHATRAPWSYAERDPKRAFRAARRAALAGAS